MDIVLYQRIMVSGLVKLTRCTPLISYIIGSELVLQRHDGVTILREMSFHRVIP